jgi:hypothetical protein
MIADDLIAALRALGCEVRVLEVTFEKSEVGAGIRFDPLIDGDRATDAHCFDQIDAFGPDLVLCINNYGLDAHASLHLIAELKETPFVNWFVDDPEFAPPHYLDPEARFVVNAVFDAWYVDRLIDKGMARSFHLPLAVNPARFSAAGNSGAAWRSPAPVVFVGAAGLSLLDKTFSQMLRHIQGDPKAIREALFAEVKRGAQALRARPGMSITDYLSDEVCSRPGVFQPSPIPVHRRQPHRIPGFV